MARVLVVEDDAGTRRIVQANLAARQYEVTAASDGEQALEMVSLRTMDLVLLDLMLPKVDGLEVCRQIREWSSVPIIVISSKGQERDVVTALDAGADDYIVKPFGIDALLARVRAVLRRSSMPQSSAFGLIAIGGLSIDLAKHKVTLDGGEIKLTPTEYRMLSYMASNCGKVISHVELLRHVWGPEYGQEKEYLRVFIGQLRRKIEANPSRPKYITTVSYCGYRFEELPEVGAASQATAAVTTASRQPSPFAPQKGLGIDGLAGRRDRPGGRRVAGG